MYRQVYDLHDIDEIRAHRQELENPVMTKHCERLALTLLARKRSSVNLSEASESEVSCQAPGMSSQP